MARINCKYASSPIIFVAPHGHQSDDYNTALFAEKAADIAGGSYLINCGFQRDIKVNESKDLADCNNFLHMSDPILFDEFLTPFRRMCLRAKKFFGTAFVVFVHGVSDKVRTASGVYDVDMILGYGLGKPESRSCIEISVNKFIYTLAEDGIVCAKGKAGGKYSGHSRNNMNQYWRKIELDMHINSIQLEIIKELRGDKIITELTAETVARAAEKSATCTSFYLPSDFRCDFI